MGALEKRVVFYWRYIFLIIFLLAVSFLFPMIFWILSGVDAGIRAEDIGFFSLMKRTIFVSFSCAIITTLITFFISFFYIISKKKMRIFITALLLTSLAIPAIGRNRAWEAYLMSDFALIQEYSFFAVLLVMVSMLMPMATFLQIIGLSRITNTQINASLASGVNLFKRFIFIYIRGSMHIILTTFFVIFAFSLSFFVTPRVIGGGNYNFVGAIIVDFIKEGDINAASFVAFCFLCIALIFCLITTFISVFTDKQHDS